MMIMMIHYVLIEARRLPMDMTPKPEDQAGV
jgi:hypothetical protein